VNHPTGCPCGAHYFEDATRIDPTGTTGLRKKFEADLVRRFSALRGQIYQFFVTNDVLGIGKQKPHRLQIRLGDAAPPAGAYAFARDPQKVQLFMQWLRQQQDQGILQIQPGASVEAAAQSAWTNTYVETSYRKGVRDAGKKLSAGGATVAESWTEGFFNRPIHADRLGMLYTRTYSDLKGITDVMDTQISRILTEGMADGIGPMQIARKINDRVDAVGITRARTLARTEIIKAHADATLNSYREAGIEGVEVESEFTTSGDEAVCPDCEALEGKTYSLNEARGIIPVHPNCRCAWNPKVINGTGITLQ
jgi:SPP1 gp7 family putative phage head morphogenesis protein